MRLKVFFQLNRILIRLLLYGLPGSIVIALFVYIHIIDNRFELSVWHHADLDEEYSLESDISDFSQYLALEDRLFAQLDKLVYAEVPQDGRNSVNRFSRGSLSDPSRWPVNWNRSFVLEHDAPAAGVLLLHGLSDSPYSLRTLGESLNKAGAWVLGLRIPGHGTAPSGLVEVRWQDMAAAVRLAAHQVKDSVGDKPFYIIGYSNGGALAIEYSLSMLDDPSLPRPSGVVLLSPEIGITGFAALAVWQARIGHLLGVEKLAWNSVLPEYDPFKYGSFPVNAGDLAHRITTDIQQHLTDKQGTGKLEKMPPILAFQSSVDATVTPSALVENLFDRLPTAPHELVLFDINREISVGEILRSDPRTTFEPLLAKVERGFDLTIVMNETEHSPRVIAVREEDGKEGVSTTVYLNEWPAGVYSLSHVALPFAPEDPVYGGPSAGASPGIQLGNLNLKGERGVFRVPATDMLRLRWNPFFDYLESRTLQFMKLSKD